MVEEKERIGFLVSKRISEYFRQMSRNDRRAFSAEFELFVEQEWVRRHLDTVTTPNKIGKRALDAAG